MFNPLYLFFFDFSRKWQCLFQDHATSIMENSIDLPHDITFLRVAIITCSYLLVNFLYTLWIQANKSALKAIIVNRISDFALIFGIFLVFYAFLTLAFLLLNVFLDFFNFFVSNIISFFLFLDLLEQFYAFSTDVFPTDFFINIFFFCGKFFRCIYRFFFKLIFDYICYFKEQHTLIKIIILLFWFHFFFMFFVYSLGSLVKALFLYFIYFVFFCLWKWLKKK